MNEIPADIQLIIDNLNQMREWLDKDDASVPMFAKREFQKLPGDVQGKINRLYRRISLLEDMVRALGGVIP